MKHLSSRSRYDWKTRVIYVPPKTHITTEKTTTRPFKDVSPLKRCYVVVVVFPAGHVFLDPVRM